MKKKSELAIAEGSPWWRKTLFYMKLTNLLLLISAFQTLAAVSWSQTATLSLRIQNAAIKDVLQKIEDQSDYYFLYSSKVIDVERKVNVNMENVNIEKVLSGIFMGTTISYKVDGRLIVLQDSQRLVSELSSQPGTIKGSVKNVDGEYLPGVTITLKGTTKGTISDSEGNFDLKDVSAGDHLVFSFIGMKTQEIVVTDQSRINIILEEETIGIEEVVAVGYGFQKKSNLTGAVETVSVSDLKNRPLTNASLALQGNVAGAFIAQKSGQPGNDDATILIRGISTFNNSSPLVIIDGMEGSLKDINPKDMESVSILKDAASAAIYGNRAANGVILITTRRGSKDKMEVDYIGYYGVQNVTTMPDLLTGLDYLELKAQAHYNTNGDYPSWYTDPNYMNNFRNGADPILYPLDYNWIKEVFKPAAIIDNYVNMSGGNKSFQYSASVGYLDQDGIVDGNSTKKLSFRSNMTANFMNDRLRIDLYTSGNDQRTDDLVEGMETAIYGVYVASPTERLYIPGVGYSNYGYNWGATEAGGYRLTRTTPINARIAASYQLLKGLNLNASYGLYQWSWEQEIFRPSVQLFALREDGELYLPVPRTNGLSFHRQESLTKVFTANTNYSVIFGRGHTLSLMGGFESREYRYDMVTATRENFSVNLPELSVGDPNTQKNSGGASDAAWLSWFGRFNYNYKERYLFEFNARRDGSSRFIDKWGIFPSVSGAWRISEENFFKQNFSFFSSLKLRASWGKLGNESIGQYYAASDELSLNLTTNFNNTLNPAAAVTKLANRKTSWETSEQIDLGLDFGVLDHKISGTVDYFIKKNYDILMQIPVSGTLGISTTPYQNVGKMKNNGIEFKISYNGKIRDVKVDAGISAAHTVNKIESLSGQDPIIMGNLIWKEGKAYNSFYGYEIEGIYQSQTEIDNHLLFTNSSGDKINPYVGLTPYPGDIRLKDQLTIDSDGDGIADARDGIVNADDKTILGKPYPDWTFSSQLNFEWKQFDLSLFFQGVYGIESLNQGMVTSPFHGGSANTGAWYKDAWTPENPSRTIQRVNSDPTRFEIVSEYYLEDASYIRLKNIEVGYTLPKRILADLRLTNLRIYASCQNAFTLTNMRYGFDPEKPGTTTNTYQYPQTRIFITGINLKF